MTDWKDIVEVLRQQGMPPEGIRMVKSAYDEAPVRPELGHSTSVRTDFYSRKTGRTFRTESHTNELPLAEELERDSTVLWYVLQPFKFELVVGEGVGSTRVRVVPDALVVRLHSTGIEEWKPTKDYWRLPEKSPRRYRFDGDEVTSPAMVAKVSAWGMGFKVRHPGHLSGEFLENCQLLEDYLGPDAPKLSLASSNAIQVAFEQQGVWTIDSLREAFPVLTADDVYVAIAEGLAFFDLHRDRLANPHVANVYSSELRARIAQRDRAQQMQALMGPAYFDIVPGMVFALDGNQYTIEVEGDREVIVHDAAGKQRRFEKQLLVDAYPTALRIVSIPQDAGSRSELAMLLEFTSDKDLADAERKLAIVRGELPADDTPKRTLSSWRRRVADAEAQGHDGLVGLIPRRMAQGNRQLRIDEDNLKLIEEVLDERYYTPESPTKRSAYGFYTAACLERKVLPVSEQWFGEYADRLETVERQFKRYGKRKANAKRPAHIHEEFAPSVHGTRALDILAIDHTLADVELRSEFDGLPLGRPWLSIAVCTYSRKVEAEFISFQPPNASVVLTLLREVARREGRLPRLLVLDNGSDFRTEELKRFCRAYRIRIRWRPVGNPRFGAVVEREFGKVNSEFLHRLRGSTKVMVAVRTVTGSHLPAEVTLWTLRHLKIALQVYIFEVHNEDFHPTAAPATRNQVCVLSREKHGKRDHRRVIVDRTMEILTCPFVERRTRKINRQTGVKVKEVYYHDKELRVPALDGVMTEVRYDPANVDIVHVRDPIQKRWITAHRVNRLDARGLNTWELQLFTAELVRRKVLTVEQANDDARVAREARLCGLIEDLEKQANLIFRKLREEGKVGTGGGQSKAPSADQARTAPESAETEGQDELAIAVPTHSFAYDDYSGGLA